MTSQPGSPPSNATVSLCATCGIVAPVHGSSCVVCKRPFENPRRMVMTPGDIAWVALRCTFPCRSCAFPSPLEGIELDAGVNCAQCGAFQRFDKGGWDSALEFAHEIADLAGPSPEGRFPNPRVWIGDTNPHRMVGLTNTFGSKNVGPIQVEASPGFPTCAKCRAPLEVRIDGNIASTRCPGCREQARFELPAEARGFLPAIQGVVSPEQRVDRQSVKVQQTQAGLVALHCPQCGAAVRPADGDTVECTYCKVVAFLPARVRTRGGGQIVEAPVFWVAVRGPSERRVKLETPQPEVTKNVVKKAAGFFRRGLSPLPGIELAPQRPGLDVKQLALTVGLTLLAVLIGAAIVTIDGLLE